VPARRLGSGKAAEKLETAGMMRWLLTYADMITLMLALFIILFSISTINKVKLQRLVHDLGGGFSSTDALNQPPNGLTNASTPTQLEAMQAQLQSYIKSNNLQSKVQTQIRQEGNRKELVISLLTDKALYDSGSAEIRPETKAILDEIYKQLKSRPNEVRIEGHTDNVPISTPLYPSNWELSAARASNVTRYLVEHDGLQPNRVGLAGYGEFRPKVPNDTDEHRQENRRVDVVVLDVDRPGSPNDESEGL
jgi:chemotaxis protein MotB